MLVRESAVGGLKFSIGTKNLQKVPGGCDSHEKCQLGETLEKFNPWTDVKRYKGIHPTG